MHPTYLLVFFLSFLLHTYSNATLFSEVEIIGLAHYRKYININKVSSGIASFQDLAEKFCLNQKITTTHYEYLTCVTQLLGEWIKQYLADVTPTTRSTTKTTKTTKTKTTRKILSRNEVLELYATHIHKTVISLQDHQELFSKYVDDASQLPLLKYDTPRMFTLFDFSKWMKEFNIVPQSVLSLNRHEPELKSAAFQNTSVIHYATYNPETEENDLLNFNLKRHDFDFFLSSNVLEHVQDPLLAVISMYQHLRPGWLI